jgi:hypothetical protein
MVARSVGLGCHPPNVKLAATEHRTLCIGNSGCVLARCPSMGVMSNAPPPHGADAAREARYHEAIRLPARLGDARSREPVPGSGLERVKPRTSGMTPVMALGPPHMV